MSKTLEKETAKKQALEINELQKIQQFLITAYPSARVNLEKPLLADGVWSLDFFLEDYHLAVAWKKGKGFGVVSNEMHGYGEGADEVYEDIDTALANMVALINKKGTTTPPEAIRLKEIRELRKLSQEEVAKRLGKKQASISRTEGRSDFLVSTLQEFAYAFGAKLVVKMVFSDGEKELQLDENTRLEPK